VKRGWPSFRKRNVISDPVPTAKRSRLGSFVTEIFPRYKNFPLFFFKKAKGEGDRRRAKFAREPGSVAPRRAGRTVQELLNPGMEEQESLLLQGRRRLQEREDCGQDFSGLARGRMGSSLPL
jgi:hypothetical protein